MTISDMNLSGSGWGYNGSAFCDNYNRCISDAYTGVNAGTGLMKFTMPTCEQVLSATLNFSTTEWESVVPKAEIRRVLKTVTWPTCPFSGAVSNSVVGWRFASSGVSWNTLGAKGVGTDVSEESASVSVGYGSNISHSLDVTDVVAGCTSNSECVLAAFSVPDVGQTSPAKHYWLITGSPSLVLECGESGSSGAGGNSGTTTSSTSDTTTTTSSDSCE